MDIDDNHYGFCSGRSSTGAILIVRQLQEKFVMKKKKLYHIFVDLVNAFDLIPRDVIERALRRKGIPDSMVKAIMALYAETTSRVRTGGGISEEFDIAVGVKKQTYNIENKKKCL